MPTAKAQIRLRVCAVWSGPSLPASRINRSKELVRQGAHASLSCLSLFTYVPKFLFLYDTVQIPENEILCGETQCMAYNYANRECRFCRVYPVRSPNTETCLRVRKGTLLHVSPVKTPQSTQSSLRALWTAKDTSLLYTDVQADLSPRWPHIKSFSTYTVHEKMVRIFEYADW